MRIMSRTIGVKNFAQELHCRRCQRIVLGELELSREDAAFEGSTLGPLNQRLPLQEVIFAHGAGGDAIRWVVCQGTILLKESAMCCGCHVAGAGCKMIGI